MGIEVYPTPDRVKSTQEFSITITSGNLTQDATISAISTKYRIRFNGSRTTGAYPDDAFITVERYDSTTLRATRGASDQTATIVGTVEDLY